MEYLTINYGNHQGKHPIYFIDEMPPPDIILLDYTSLHDTLAPYLDEDGMLMVDNIYIRTMDGFKIPLFRYYKYTKNKNYTPIVQHWVVHAFGTSYYHKNKDGTWRYKNLYINRIARTDDNYTRIKVNSTTRVAFGELLKQGKTLEECFDILFVRPNMKISYIKRQEVILWFLKDTYIQNILKELSVMELKDKIKLAIPEEEIVQHIKALLDNSRLGSMNHRENIKFILNVMGYVTEVKAITPTLTPYEEVPPMELQSATKDKN